jgi:hypothetical protein
VTDLEMGEWLYLKSCELSPYAIDKNIPFLKKAELLRKLHVDLAVEFRNKLREIDGNQL